MNFDSSKNGPSFKVKGIVFYRTDGLEALGGALAALAPGLGAATVTRFLAPLRALWPAAADLPVEPAVLAAGCHLGLLAEDQDLEGAAAVLVATSKGPDPVDLEAALARLGRRACLRGRYARCPLGASCPAHSEDSG